MDLRKKINFKLYFSLSITSTVFCLFFTKNNLERIAIVAVYIATLLNHVLLTWAVIELLAPLPPLLPGPEQRLAARKRNIKLVLGFIGKMAILLVGLSLGVHFMGHRVIIPLLNYVTQIFILVVSFKRKAEAT